jgi:hypothetical protein
MSLEMNFRGERRNMNKRETITTIIFALTTMLTVIAFTTM